uniref:FAD-binding and (Fe-S)-binding domain-containing protein n=1 Tax=Prevotella sp. TaxID=59823 RepID=UPI004029DC28
MSNDYISFLKDIRHLIPESRVYTDELRRLAWGTDASFYRLVPQIVIRSDSEAEISGILKAAQAHRLPVTFRAAGTSLSGQSISDSILVVAGKHWEKYEILDHGKTIRLQPGLIGQRVNDLLKPYGRKLGPDPASVKSAMVGGIVMNNASGMNCGTHANSDKMMNSVRIILADGTVLDTGDEASRKAFRKARPDFIRSIEQLRDKVRANKKLCDRINYKYAIKNVTGLNILPFVRFDDPFDIIAHLMVGSEGTLAFLAGVSMNTEYDYPFKASAMLYFKDIREACKAVVAMKKLVDDKGQWIVKSAELLDKKSLASVNDTTGEGLTAILTETKASTAEELRANISKIEECLKAFTTYVPVRFTDKPEEYSKFWAVRSGVFPAVGGTRKLGTTCLIEDVAFHIEDLPDATADLQELIARHGYDDACIYGHTLEGNYHFIINQSFDSDAEVRRYESLMNDVKTLVVDKYDGSLKAEHGTGRNMAPFVRYEWGDDAYAVMKAVKQLFDPNGLLNPGVIFNDDPKCHLKHFKPLPMTDPIVDRCIECGFCEVNCLTCGFALSSRQRIVIQREMTRLRNTGEDPRRLQQLEKEYKYWGNATCAGDGMCSTSCPMHINTGELTHVLRQKELPEGSLGYKAGDLAAKHLAGIKATLRPMLTLADTAHAVLGTKTMSAITRGMHQALKVPQWTPAMPKAFHVDKGLEASQAKGSDKVVYFPSCINQTMGLPRKTREKMALVNKMVSLLHKAVYEILYPKAIVHMCC